MFRIILKLEKHTIYYFMTSKRLKSGIPETRLRFEVFENPATENKAPEVTVAVDGQLFVVVVLADVFRRRWRGKIEHLRYDKIKEDKRIIFSGTCWKS